jgi:hypothetical protein
MIAGRACAGPFVRGTAFSLQAARVSAYHPVDVIRPLAGGASSPEGAPGRASRGRHGFDSPSWGCSLLL